MLPNMNKTAPQKKKEANIDYVYLGLHVIDIHKHTHIQRKIIIVTQEGEKKSIL